jgi:hypothetical protein
MTTARSRLDYKLVDVMHSLVTRLARTHRMLHRYTPVALHHVGQPQQTVGTASMRSLL